MVKPSGIRHGFNKILARSLVNKGPGICSDHINKILETEHFFETFIINFEIIITFRILGA